MSTKIAIFNQSGLNGSGVGDDSDENSNLLSIIKHLIDTGSNYTIEAGITSFTDTNNLQAKLSSSDFFFMTDMEEVGNGNQGSAFESLDVFFLSMPETY